MTWNRPLDVTLGIVGFAILLYWWRDILLDLVISNFSNLDTIPHSWMAIGYSTTNLRKWRKFLRGIKKRPDDYVISLRREAAAINDRPGLVALTQRLRDLEQIFFSAGSMVTVEIIAERQLLENRLATWDQAGTGTRTKTKASKKKAKEAAKAKVVSRYTRLLKDD